MEVCALCAGGEESYDSRSERAGQYICDGRYCHIRCVLLSDISEVPLWTHPRDFCFFPPKRYVSDKQKTEGAFLGFCFVKQNKETSLVVDQQLLVYIVEKVQRSQSAWKGFQKLSGGVCLKELVTGKSKGNGKGTLSHTFYEMSHSTAGFPSVSLAEEWSAFVYFHNFSSCCISWQV